jgi:hypothetical protein
MSDTIDTITEVEAMERDAQEQEVFRRRMRRPHSQEEEQERRMVAEQDGQLQKRLTSSSERILSACTGAFLTTLLGKNTQGINIILMQLSHTEYTSLPHSFSYPFSYPF